MELYEIQNLTGSRAMNSGSTSLKTSTRSSEVKNSFAALLQDRLTNLKEDLEEMEERRKMLKEVEETHEELTGRASGEDADTQQPETEIIKRILPDGSIRVTTVENGSVTEQYVKKPEMIAVPDSSVPEMIDGVKVPDSERIQWKPHYNVLDMM